MNERLNEFIEENYNNIVLYGQSCIGKSHFAAQFWGKDHKKQTVGYGIWGQKTVKYYCKHDPVMITDKKIIVLGAPYFIWKQRVKERRKSSICPPTSFPHLDALAKFTISQFKENYVNCISLVDECIFVDYRNDYPILDKSDFFTMLGEGK